MRMVFFAESSLLPLDNFLDRATDMLSKFELESIIF